MRPDTARSLTAVAVAAILLSTAGLSAVPGHTSSPYRAPVHVSDTLPDHDGEPADSVRPAPADSTDAGKDGMGQDTRSGDYADGAIPVPGQPEAKAFAPTMMGDIEAATPTAGITLITPPSANNRGTASLQYPFIMPPARNGMSPSLGLSYDSDAGDGLCGEGWTLPIPSVTVDTRWGVPRYDPSDETETYLLNGQMLAMRIGRNIYLAHRQPGIKRNTASTRIFRPRVESDFSLIERTGYTPSTYQWKVTAPDGTLYTYGGGNATLKGSFTDASGATRTVISEWLLSRIDDPHGDHVDFEYMTRTDTVAGGLTAVSVYLRQVTASTHFESQDSLHTVVTLAYDSVKRTTPVSGRYGFLTASRRLLTGVTVAYRGSRLRSYQLEYAPGRFGRSLLRRVTHYDDRDSVAAFQEFGYYDETDGPSGLVRPQNEAAVIIADDDSLDESFFINKSDNKSTLLGSSATQSKSVSLYAGVGVWDGSLWKSNTAGASYEYSDDQTKGIVALTDMDGDGLPDKLFRKGGGLWYRPMLVSANGGMSFGVPVRLGTSVGSFSTVKSHTSNIGVRGVAGVSEITYQKGWDWHSTKSRTTEYMADVNGDGLPDLVSGGKVWFNHIETSDDTTVPTFTEGSHLSPNPVRYTASPDSSVISAPAQSELDSIADSSPMQDIVRVWEAPADGTVIVSGDVRLQDPPPGYDDSEYEKADGVRVAIEKDSVTLWSRTMMRDDHAAYQPTGVSSVSVTRGDRIYFRLQCGGFRNSNGAYDRVIWSPTVRYSTAGAATTPDGVTAGVYPCSQEVMANTGETTSTGSAASIRLRGMMVKPLTSDSVVFLAVATNNRVDSQGLPLPDFQSDTIFYKRLLYNETINRQVDTVVSNSRRLPYIKTELSSPTNVRWNAVRWTPAVCYTDSAGNYQKTTVVPCVNAFTQTFQEPTSVVIGSQGAMMTVSPWLSLPSSVNGKVRLVVKGLNSTWGTKEYDVVSGAIPNTASDLVLTAPTSGPVWVEYYWPDTLGTHTSVSCSATMQVNGSPVASSFSCGFHARRADLSMGLMHRGWGGFAYSAGGGRYAHPISESLLRAPEVSEGDTLRLAQLSFMPLTARADTLGNLSWAGQRDDIFITDNYMGAARLGDQDVTWSNPLSLSCDTTMQGNGDLRGTGASAPVLVSSSSGRTEQDGISFLGPDFTQSMSSSTTKGDITTLDMNGDGYPDIIAGGTIQYTNTLGGMSGESVCGMQRPESSATSEAYGVGGSPVNATSTIVSVVRGGKASASGRLASQLAKISMSGNDSQNYDGSKCDYQDINGDGLPDLLREDDTGVLTARLNLGYSFSESVPLGTGHIQRGVSLSSNKSITSGDGFGFGSLIDGTDIHIASSSFSAGVGVSSTISREKESLTDINGDGLPDIVWTNASGIWARLNMGDSFTSDSVKWADGGDAGVSTTTGESANGAFTVTVNVPVIGMKFSVNPGAASGKSVTKTRTAIRDIDGDGFPDLVSSNSESGLSVRYSAIRRTNRLRTVTNSLGGRFTLDYAHTAPTYGLPGGKWVMSSVETDRGIHFPGYDIPVTRSTFTYSGGTRDRREREFLGFGEVVTTDLDTQDGDAPRRSLTETFNVSSYYNKGLLLTATVCDADGDKFTETKSVYSTYSIHPRAGTTVHDTLYADPPSDTWPVACPRVKFRESRRYEGGTAAVTEQSAYRYKAYDCGELSSYYYSRGGMSMTMASGDVSGYDYHTSFSYSSLSGNYNTSQRRTISRPTSVTVKDSSGAVLRKTTAAYAGGKNASKATSVTRTISLTPSVTAVTSYSYDNNTGNLNTLSHASESGDLIYTYQYNDDTLQTYPYKITAPHDLSTDIEGMCLPYGLPTRQKDPNNKVFSTIYDGLGRLISVKSPNESERYPSTVDMSYVPMAVTRADGTGIQTPAYAVTTYHLRQPYNTSDGSFTHDDSMRVVTFVDGFGEVVQTRRESVIDNGSGGQCRQVVIDGCKDYDGLGRAVRAYYPAQADSTTLMAYQPAAQTGEYSVITEYDVLDRPVTVTAPDNAVTSYGYDVSGGCLRTAVTDPLGHRSETYADASGRTVRTVMYRDSAATQPIETRYVYDPVGRLTTVINAAGDSTRITYDMLDRRTEVRHPASGVTRWTYDKAGNVLTEENETLRARGDAVRYTWDIDRLTSKVCQGDTVRLFYGEGNDGGLVKGRLRFRLDPSGGTEYRYDNMGNVSYERRTVIVPGKGHATFETSWEYDSYGKLLRMTYPGDEGVVYLYNSTGGLRRVYTGWEDNAVDYVSSIVYDRFGDRVRMTHGNGIDTRSYYDPRTRRLSSLYYIKDRFMAVEKEYTYDKAGNIKRSEGFFNSYLIHLYDYSYDALGRLNSATQYCLDNPFWAKDTLAMSYDDLWRVTSKSQHVSGNGIMSPGLLSAGYDMTYTYGTEPGTHYQLRNVAETHYRTEATPTAADRNHSTHSYSYDPNGNLAYVATGRRRSDGSSTPKMSERKLLWDAQNRLRALSDDGYVSLYWYDADGNRTVKEHHGGEAVWVNSAQAGQHTDSVVYSIYPSPYININGDHWTKHYYIGPERVASSTGKLNAGFGSLYYPGNVVASPGPPDNVNYTAMRHVMEDSIASVYERLGVPYEPQRVGIRGEGGHLYIPITLDEENAGDISAETADTPDGSRQRSHPSTLVNGHVYYYHRDHLGSTQAVTDGAGDFTQFVEYTPWGEVFVELKGDSILTTPYLFNGKELDEETGLYYYGARYYDPKMSVWYSTDPMEMDYPWVSTYSFTMNNPLFFIDKDGNKVVPLLYLVPEKASVYYSYPYKGEIHNYNIAMREFVKTSFGKKIISDFTPKNEKYMGVSGNGRFSKYDLEIRVHSFKNEKQKYQIWRDKNGSFGIEEKDGRLKFFICVNVTSRETGDVLETILHELALHGDAIENIISAYEKSGYEGAKEVYHLDDGGKIAHKDLANKNMSKRPVLNYYQTMYEILRNNNSYRKSFENAIFDNKYNVEHE